MNDKTQLLLGDCIDLMRTIPKGSIDLVVTSPPYDNLRAYNNSLDWNEDVWKASLCEIYSVLKTGGVAVWVVGDATVKGSETGTSFKQALFAKEVGFNLHDTMIYQKANPIPQNHNRYEQSFEFMFVFSKGVPVTFNPILEPTKNQGKVFNWGDRKTELDANQCRRHRKSEYITTKSHKQHSNIFTYSIGGKVSGHPAVFPEDLARDHISTWSNEGETVLDPFMGSGTTGIACLKLNRNFIGVEKDEVYFNLAKNRLDNYSKSIIRS